MKNFENQSQSTKQRYFPVRRPDDPHSVDLIPITEEQYQKVNRIINRKRKQEQRSSRCFSPRELLWKCSADCDVCPYHKNNECLSLDNIFKTEDDFPSSLLEILADETDIADEFEQKELKEAIHLALQDLSPRDQKIAELFMKGLSERAIAAEVGCSQKTVNLRKSAIFKILLKKLEGWF